MTTRHTFTSESVTEGHPDKMADQISDSVLDAVLESDPNGRVACETLLTTGLVVVAGEISTQCYIDIATLVRDVVCDIGYDSDAHGFNGRTCGVMVALDEQSPDIAQGVTAAHELRTGSGGEDQLNAQGAGDQGMMFGYACDETPDLMPLPIWMAHRLAQRLSQVRRVGVLPYLRPDGKTQVSVVYEGGRPVAIDTVLISTQHAPGCRHRDAAAPRPPGARDPSTAPARPRHLGAARPGQPHGPIRARGAARRHRAHGPQDHRGHLRRHGPPRWRGLLGEGPFEGRPLGGLRGPLGRQARRRGRRAASRCEVQVAYAIGVASPVSLMVETFGTETVDPVKIEQAVREVFDLRPAAIVRDLDLKRPIYRRTAAYGHFGRSDKEFTWEATPRVDDLKRALGL